MVNIITTNSYFNLVKVLCEQLKKYPNGLDDRNMVFCEEKISLMLERHICKTFNGSFSTSVYSFGNYLRVNRKTANALSKEGSAMVIKKLLQTLNLKCFNRSKENLAPTLYELLILLKSAQVKVSDLNSAIEKTSGILKNKLTDIVAVYNNYEQYLTDNSLEDQSSLLSHLTEVIENDEKLKSTNVFIVGFIGFTAQIGSAVKSLIKCAKSVTVILTDGGNRFSFVGETQNTVKDICVRLNKEYRETFIDSDYNNESRIIIDNIFSPISKVKEKYTTDKIYVKAFLHPQEEANRIAGIIKSYVMENKIRYRDCIVIAGGEEQKECLEKAFDEYEIPCVFDDRKKPDNHPLISLIYSYIDVFTSNFERQAVLSFIKNPLIVNDKTLLDNFENYIYKYDINYSRFNKPFTLGDSGEVDIFESLRKDCMSHFKGFDIQKLLLGISAESKINGYSDMLKEKGETELSAINSQIYQSVSEILNQMQMILGDAEISYREFKTIFQSGVASLQISIIPQINDAVFVAGFKEASLVKSKYLFAIGLTNEVPQIKDDVSLITDSDIDALKDIQLIIEPKIRIVNHRQREQVACGLSAFSEKLFLSYPVSTLSGKKTVKSEIITFIERTFNTNNFEEKKDYLTLKNSLKEFSVRCGEYVYGETVDFEKASSFYMLEKEKAEKIVQNANREMVVALKDGRALIKGITSPTAIEEFYMCPYKMFVSRTLGIKDRDTGKPDGLSIGTIVHEIFMEFFKVINDITDENFQSEFNKIGEKVLSNPNYGRFLNEKSSKYTMDSLLEECKVFCYKNYKWQKDSQFKIGGGGLEVKFGKGGKYPAVSLLNGKASLSGTIDRIDTYGDYCRVVDYKTGNIDASEKGLFSGTKLQLYLYAGAVNDKNLAGAYYMPIKDEFGKADDKQSPLVYGKTLEDDNAVFAQDQSLKSNSVSDYIPIRIKDGKIEKASSQIAIDSMKQYAVKVSENAIKEMMNGVIVPSPYENACEYCSFKCMCKIDTETAPRKLKSVSEKIIIQSVENDNKENGDCAEESEGGAL